MKRWIWVLALAGCVDDTLVINRYYRESGYLVRGVHGVWVYDESRSTDALTYGEGFQERVYTDNDRDGKPDLISYRDEKIRRGSAGSEKLFQEADDRFEQARRRYEIAEIDREWRAMTPDERARRHDYFK
jgi:hypothetical protein